MRHRLASSLPRLVRWLACLVSLWAAAPSLAQEPAAESAQLPALGTAPYAEAHAVYLGDAYEAVVDIKGVLTLRLREKKTAIGPAWVIGRPVAFYFHKTRRQLVSRSVVAFVQPPKASRQPAQVQLTGLLEDRLSFTVTYVFKSDSISVSGGFAEPAGERGNGQFRLQCELAPLVAPAMNDDAMMKGGPDAKTLRRWKLESKEWVNERSVDRDWTWADRPNFDQPLRSLRLGGPWGSRGLEFSTRGSAPPLRAELPGRDGPASGLLLYGFTSTSQLTPPAITYSIYLR